MKRKETFQQLCGQATSPLIDFLPLSDQNAMNYSNILYSDFFGVRGNRSGAEPINDQQIIAIIQECEKHFNHSAAYISLLGQGMKQKKIYTNNFLWNMIWNLHLMLSHNRDEK